MKKFTHLDEKGKAAMVDVTAKEKTLRRAQARGTVIMQPRHLRAHHGRGDGKGGCPGSGQRGGDHGGQAHGRAHPPVSSLRHHARGDLPLTRSPNTTALILSLRSR